MWHADLDHTFSTLVFVFRPEGCNFLVALLHWCPLLLSYDSLLATFTSCFLSFLILPSFLLSHCPLKSPESCGAKHSSCFDRWWMLIRSTRKLQGCTCVGILAGLFFFVMFFARIHTVAWWWKSHSCLTKPGKRADIRWHFKTTDWAER